MLLIILLLFFQPVQARAAQATIQVGERRLLDAKAVPAEGGRQESFVPVGWRIEARQEGDLNGDGLPDAALQLVEDLPLENKDGTLIERFRALVILFKRSGGTYERAAVAARLLYCSLCGGMLGDPEGANISVEMKDGVLVVSQLSGAREATEHTWRFRHDPRLKRFALIGEDVDHYDRLKGGGTNTSTNYLTGLRVTQKSAVLKEGREPRVTSTKRTRVRPARRFLEDVDYEAQ